MTPDSPDRDMDTARASSAIQMAIGDIARKHNLTYAETMGILGQVIADWSKYVVTRERDYAPVRHERGHNDT